MSFNIKNKSQKRLLLLPLVLTVVLVFFSNLAYAQTYVGCYQKDKDKQKQCIENMFDDLCGKKKGDEKKECLATQSENVRIVWNDLIEKCAERNNNTKQECRKKYVSPADVKGYVKSNKDDGSDETTIPNEAEAQAYSCDGKSDAQCLAQNPIVKWIRYGINLLAGIVGVGAILMVIWGGIQYITARDNPQNVAAAKQKIINVVIGLVAFIFLWAFLQWLIPGGAFKG